MGTGTDTVQQGRGETASAEGIATESGVAREATSAERSPSPVSRPVGARRLPWGGVRDVLLALLGAALALAGEQWRDARADRRRAAVAEASIRAELVENRKRVQAARAHHLEMADTLSGYVARHELPPQRVYFGGLFRPAVLLSTAWQTAHETGALNDMSYQVALTLGPIYERQQSYRTLGDALGQTAMSEVLRRGVLPVFRDDFANFMVLEHDFANREMDLTRYYDEALARLDSLGAH